MVTRAQVLPSYWITVLLRGINYCWSYFLGCAGMGVWQSLSAVHAQLIRYIL
jgi:hypothetical protein